MSTREEIESSALSKLREIYSNINYDSFKRQVELQSNIGCAFHIQFFYDPENKEIKVLKIGRSEDGCIFDYTYDEPEGYEISYITGKKLDNRGQKFLDIDHFEKFFTITLPSAPNYKRTKIFKDFLNDYSDPDFYKFENNLKMAGKQRQSTLFLHDMIKRKSSIQLVFDGFKIRDFNQSTSHEGFVNDYYIYFLDKSSAYYIEELNNSSNDLFLHEIYMMNDLMIRDFITEGLQSATHSGLTINYPSSYKDRFFFKRTSDNPPYRKWIMPKDMENEPDNTKISEMKNLYSVYSFTNADSKYYTDTFNTSSHNEIDNYTFYLYGDKDDGFKRLKNTYSKFNYNYLYLMMPNCKQGNDLMNLIPKGSYQDDINDTKINKLPNNDIYKDIYIDRNFLEDTSNTNIHLFSLSPDEILNFDPNKLKFYIKKRNSEYFVWRDFLGSGCYTVIPYQDGHKEIKLSLTNIRNLLYTEELVEGTLIRCVYNNKISFTEELSDIKDLQINGHRYCNQMYKIKNPVNPSSLEDTNCFVYMNDRLLLPEFNNNQINASYNIIKELGPINMVKLTNVDIYNSHYRTFCLSNNEKVEITNEYLSLNNFKDFRVPNVLATPQVMSNYITTLFGDYYLQMGDNRYKENVSYLMLKRRRNYKKDENGENKLIIQNNKFTYPDGSNMKPYYFIASFDENSPNRIKILNDNKSIILFSRDYDLNPYNVEIYINRKRFDGLINDFGYCNAISFYYDLTGYDLSEVELTVIIKYQIDRDIWNNELTNEEKSHRPRLSLEDFNSRNWYKSDIMNPNFGNYGYSPVPIVIIDNPFNPNPQPTVTVKKDTFIPITEENYEENPLEYNLFLATHMMTDRMDALRVFRNLRVINCNHPLSDEDYNFNRNICDNFFPLTYITDKIPEGQKYVLKFPYVGNLYTW